MPFVVFFLLLLCFLLSGYGLLTLFGLRLKMAYTITLSLLLGIAVASFIPFLLQLFYIVLTPATIFGSLLLAALLLNTPTLRRIRKEGLPSVSQSFGIKPFRIQPYEIPYLLILGFLIFVSVWRCYYLPPTSRDALSGPEAIAEYAVREHTMINSFFSIDLWSTNNQFKSPFLISLQMICKMAGFPFGQVWLSVVFVSFTVFLYHALKEKLHPIIAGLLLLLLMMAPELYAYTFMILYDYSNMVFFFLSLYFLFDYFSSLAPAVPAISASLADTASTVPAPPPARQQAAPANRQFYFAGLLMGIATYIRSETLVLALLFLPLILIAQRRAGHSLDKAALAKKMVLGNILFFLPSLLGYYLTAQLYIGHYLPVHYDIGGLVNSHLTDLHPLFQRYKDIVTRLLSGEFAIQLWGYLFYLTAFLFLAECIFMRRFSRPALNWLYAIVVVYLGLGALGYLLPMMNLDETTKRALFKLLPLALFYLANNGLLIRLSQWISRWETTERVPSVPPSSGKTATAAAPAGKAPAPGRPISPSKPISASKPAPGNTAGKSAPGKKRKK
jgi:hypothetical protein